MMIPLACQRNVWKCHSCCTAQIPLCMVERRSLCIKRLSLLSKDDDPGSRELGVFFRALGQFSLVTVLVDG